MRRLILPAALVAAALATAAPAVAGPLEDFRQDGLVDPCQYTPGELDEARQNLPPDVVQYSPGLVDQLAAGQEGCGGGAPDGPSDPRQFEEVDTPDGTEGAAGVGGAGPGAGTGASTRIPDPPAPGAADRARLADIATPPVSATAGSDVPGWMVVLLLVLVAGALLFALGRARGVSAERFTGPVGASLADAGGRTADTVSAVWDRVRLGR